jgi:hypothetical protein
MDLVSEIPPKPQPEAGVTPFEERLLNKQDEILQQFVGFRADCERRFGLLEQRDHECHGNENPGRKKEHETHIDALESAGDQRRGQNLVLIWILSGLQAAALPVLKLFMHRHV